MKYSFILPIYKVEKYLNQCVWSILNQTYRDFEILLIDDGSPDSCPAKCDEWAKADERIKAFHKPNGGLSDARNYGLERASGEYVVFIDSDDFWIGNNALSKMNKSIELHPETDVLFFNVFYYYGDSETQSWPLYKLDDGNTHSSAESIHSLVESGTVPMTAWSKVVRRFLLTDNQIEFPLGIIGEDTPWFIDLMEKAKNIVFLNDYIYAYRQNNTTSITKTTSPKHIQDHMLVIENECAKMKDRQASDEWKKYMYSFIAYNYCILIAGFDRVATGEKKRFWKFVKDYAYLLQYDTSPKVKKAHKLSRIIGEKLTAYVLNYYLRHK